MRTYNISATKIPEETKNEIVFENTIKNFNKTVGTIGSCTVISNSRKPKIVETITTKSLDSTQIDSNYAKRMKFNIAPSTTITKINKPENSELNQESFNSEWFDNSK